MFCIKYVIHRVVFNFKFKLFPFREVCSLLDCLSKKVIICNFQFVKKIKCIVS